MATISQMHLLIKYVLRPLNPDVSHSRDPFWGFHRKKVGVRTTFGSIVRVSTVLALSSESAVWI